MKNHVYIFLAYIFLSLPIKAQITITDFHFPSIGNTYNYSTDLSSEISVSHSGENQTWDFSSVRSDFDPQIYATPETGDGSHLYPSAHMVEILYNGENYYEKTDSTIALSGNYIDTYFGDIRVMHAELVYSDAQEIFYYPLTYGDQHSFTMEGNLESDFYNAHKEGTVQLIADGYGDLILPYGTVKNVLKVSAIYNYIENTTAITDTISLWYNKETPTYIASYTVGYNPSGRYAKSIKYLDEDNLIQPNVTAIRKIEKNTSKIFPNPSKGKFTIESSTPFNKINIYNTTGLKIKEINANGIRKVSVDLSNYGPGIYLIESTENKVITRVVIQ